MMIIIAEGDRPNALARAWDLSGDSSRRMLRSARRWDKVSMIVRQAIAIPALRSSLEEVHTVPRIVIRVQD